MASLATKLNRATLVLQYASRALVAQGQHQQQQYVGRSFHSSCLVGSQMTNPLCLYSEKHSSPVPDKYTQLRARILKHYPRASHLAVPMVQGQFLQFLMKITRPQHVLELGCFMGYSAMAMADGMPVGSTLYTCEIDSKAAELSQELFKEHGYHSSSNSANIQLLKGPAMSSLQELAKKNIKFDAIFLDADKGGYIKYYDFIMDNDMLAENGYILADNTLYYGLVLDADKRHKATGSTAAASDVDTTATTKPSLTLSQQSIKFNDPAYKQAVGDKIDKFNKHVVNDPRATVVLLPAFDGLGIIMKKK